MNWSGRLTTFVPFDPSIPTSNELPSPVNPVSVSHSCPTAVSQAGQPQRAFPAQGSRVPPLLQNIPSLPIVHIKTLDALPAFPASAPAFPFCGLHAPATRLHAALLPSSCWAVSAAGKDAFPLHISLSPLITLQGPSKASHLVPCPSPPHRAPFSSTNTVRL